VRTKKSLLMRVITVEIALETVHCVIFLQTKQTLSSKMKACINLSLNAIHSECVTDEAAAGGGTVLKNLSP
jgi:hypothetical protein